MVISFSHSQVYTSTQASIVTVDVTGYISASCADHVQSVIGMPASMGQGKTF